MSKLFNYVGAFLITSIGVIACQKKTQSVENCAQSKSYDSTYVSQSVIGTWKLTNVRKPGSKKAEKIKNNLEIVWTPENTIKVYRDNQVISEGRYFIQTFINGRHPIPVLELSSPVVETTGIISVCNNELLFNGAATDGLDYIYIRK